MAPCSNDQRSRIIYASSLAGALPTRTMAILRSGSGSVSSESQLRSLFLVMALARAWHQIIDDPRSVAGYFCILLPAALPVPKFLGVGSHRSNRPHLGPCAGGCVGLAPRARERAGRIFRRKRGLPWRYESMSAVTRPRVLCLPTGPDEYAAAVVRALASVADVDFILPRPMLDRYRDDLPATVRLHPVHWPRHRDPRNLLLLARIAWIVQRRKPDVIHFLGDSVTWLVLALPFIRCPIVVTVHDVHYHPGDTQSRRVPMATVRRLRRAADALIVHGDGLNVRPRGHGGGTALPHPRGRASSAGSPGSPCPSSRPPAPARRSGTNGPLFRPRSWPTRDSGLLIEASDESSGDARQRAVRGGRPRSRPGTVARMSSRRRSWFEVRDRYVPDDEMAQLLLDADCSSCPIWRLRKVALPHWPQAPPCPSSRQTSANSAVSSRNSGSVGWWPSTHLRLQAL